jgi:hypothetical protein
MRGTLRFLPVLSAAALLVLGGVVQGIRTDRWGLSHEVQDAVTRLDQVPTTVGDWQGQPLGLDPRELDLSGSAGFALRRYTHRASGESLVVLLLCGRPGPLSIHTPDVCYRGLGYEPAGEPTRQTLAASADNPGMTFFTAQFRKAATMGSMPLRILWSWGADGVWQAPDNPRLAFAAQPVLYKLYVVRPLVREDEPLERDPGVQFLEKFLPRLQCALSSAP